MMIRILQLENSTLVKNHIHTQDSTRVLITLPTRKHLRPNNQVHPDTNQVHPVHTPAPAPATLPHAPAYTQVDPNYAYTHPQPPLYQKSSPNVLQESHPHDVRPYGPSTTTN
jgi:hypothetical protein